MKINQKGFTLIELLIVVAIIAILAAIAIPQFAQYRIRGYNSSGISDLRNCRTSEEALFADWQTYGSSYTGARPGGGGFAGAIVTGPGPAAPNVLGLTLTDPSATIRDIVIAVGNNVALQATNEAAAGATYTIATKHINGDTMYTCETESSSNWRQQGGSTWIGKTIAAAPVVATPAATTLVDITVAGGWSQM